MNAFQEILKRAQSGEESQSGYHRLDQWMEFQDRVFDHVEQYTCPQYGDMPKDQAAEFTIEEIAMNMKRYLNRVGKGQRGPEEARRDMLKVAHYACMIYAKMMEQEES
jgi:hypothetical protein